MEQNGYLIIRKQKNSIIDYKLEFVKTDSHTNYIRDLSHHFGSILSENYAGVFRKWFLNQDNKKNLVEFSKYQDALSKMNAYLNYKKDINLGLDSYFENENTFLSLNQAEEVLRLIPNNDEFEIILIQRNNFEQSKMTLGYDVGYWGDSYSIVADTFVRPTWHGPPISELGNLKTFYTKLNKNVLFNNPKDADDFLKYYRSTKWGEQDWLNQKDASMSDYTIIQISRI